MPKKDVLELTEKAIKRDFDSLDDLPYELSNTMANVYYRYFNQAADVRKQAAERYPGWIPKEMKRETDMFAGVSSFIEDRARFESDFIAALKFIRALREIDKHKKPRLYQCMVDLILDCLKYDIENVQQKSGLRRMIERKFKKGSVREIPNLVDLLDV